MAVRVKIVPKADPNAEGHWIEIPGKLDAHNDRRWNDVIKEYGHLIPSDHFPVKIEATHIDGVPAAEWSRRKELWK